MAGPAHGLMVGPITSVRPPGKIVDGSTEDFMLPLIEPGSSYIRNSQLRRLPFEESILRKPTARIFSESGG